MRGRTMSKSISPNGIPVFLAAYQVPQVELYFSILRKPSQLFQIKVINLDDIPAFWYGQGTNYTQKDPRSGETTR
jgi:hypothetical protein